MKENVIRIRSIKVDTIEEQMRTSSVEKQVLEIMETCNIDAPLVNIYRYDTPVEEFKSQIEDCLETLDKDKSVIITEAYVHKDELVPKKGTSVEEERFIDKLLDRDARMLKSIGFMDINFYVHHDWGIPFMYKNELTGKIYEYMYDHNLDKNMYGLYMLLKIDLKDSDRIYLHFKAIGSCESESFFSDKIFSTHIDSSKELFNIESNEHVDINMSYERIADMQVQSNTMRPISQTRDLSITDIKPGTMTFHIIDKMANNQITNMILLDICDTSIQIHWRRYTKLGEHTVASTQFSVVNIVKSDLYWKENGIFNIVFHIPDPKTISKPIFTYLLDNEEDIFDTDIWQSKYMDELLDRAIYKSQGIYCETHIDEMMMKKYTFRDMLTGEITYEESKSLEEKVENVRDNEE